MKSNKTFFKFLKYSFKIHKFYYILVILNAIINTSLTLFNLYSLKIILDVLASKKLDTALIYGLAIVVINFVFNFLKNLMVRLLHVNMRVLNEKVQLEVTTKLTRVPFSHLENPYYLDLKERAKFACENQSAIYQLMNLIETSIQSIITIISLGSLLITFNLYILLILLVAIGLHTLFMFLSMKFQLEFYRELLPLNRRFGYYLSTIQNSNLQKDYRLSNLGNLMANNFDHFANQTVKYLWKISKKEMTLSSFNEVVNYIQMGLVYLFVAIKAFNEKLGAGTFTFYVSSAIKFSGAVTALIEESVRFKTTIEYLKPLIELLELKEEKADGKQIELIEDIKSIEFKNVSFCYPGSDSKVLDDVSFKIKKSEKISIVGLNGAGKTTLVKLICRLYKPLQGEILINDINIHDYEYKSYIQKISAVFQDFKLFAFSISENITLEEDNHNLATQYAHQVGLKEKIDTLKEGIHSLYTKSFSEEGIELSGGEIQKIAIARSLYKDASLVILDEPTSALDPLAEADIYQNFNSMVKDKTAIYISHRMSSSVFCDKVLIIEKGKVIDFDSHNNLMKKEDSLYFQLFTTQAKNYQI